MARTTAVPGRLFFTAELISWVIREALVAIGDL